MKKIILSMLFCLSLVITGISCGGESGSTQSDSDNKAEVSAYNTSLLKITSLKTTSGTVFKSGRPNNVIVGINSASDAVATDIPVTFYIMPEDATVSDTSGDETIYSGTYIIPEVKSGDGEYTLSINVPEIDEGTYGSYKIIACFYDQVMQSPTVDGTKNISDDPVEPIVNENATIGELDVPLDPKTSQSPDIYIEKAELSADGLTLFTNAINPLNGNSEFSININTQVLAKDVSNATVSFSLQSLDKKFNKPLRVKLTNGTFADTIDVGPMKKYNEMVLSYTLDLSEHVEELVNLIEANKPVDNKYEFVIVTNISSPEETDDGNGLENNTVNSSFWIVADDSVFLPAADIKDFGFDWSKNYGNSYIGGGIVLSSHTGMDANKIYTKNIAKAPFSILKYHFNAFETYVKGETHYIPSSTDRISVKLSFPGLMGLPNSIYQYNELPKVDWKTSRIRSIDGIIADLKNKSPADVEYFNGTSPHQGDFYCQMEYHADYFVMVGPIPVTFGWKVSGYVGLEAFAHLEGKLSDEEDATTCAAAFIPNAGLSATAGGGIGCSLASVTIQMRVNLIDLKMKNVAWLDYKKVTGGDNKSSLHFDTNIYSGINLTFLSGKLYLEARYPGIKWKKKKWGRYAVVCTITKDKTIYEYDGISNNYDIIPCKPYEFLIPLPLK